MTPRAELEARLERGRQALRRQGMADACFILVAKNFRPGTTLEDYARLLGVDQLDLQRARDRRRGWVAKPVPAKRPPAKRTVAGKARAEGPFECPEHGCTAVYDDRRGLASHRIAAHSDPVPCPNGCDRLINPKGLGPHLKHCTGAPS